MNKEFQMKLLSLIERDSKLTDEELAAMLNCDAANVRDALSELENDQVICGYHTLINWDKISDNRVTALIEVRVTPQRGQGFDAIAERIYHYAEVRAVYLISGGYDLLVILEGHSIRDVSFFVSDKLATLDSVLSTATHFILRKYKDHGTVFDGEPPRDERVLVTL